MDSPTLPLLDLSLASDPSTKPLLLAGLKSALFHTGFLYLTNHGIPPEIIAELASRVPALFRLSPESREKISMFNSPHFVGFSGFAEERTRGKIDLREQFDFASELPVVWQSAGEEKEGERDFSKLYWRLRGPNQWPDENEENLKGFRKAFENYMSAVGDLSLRLVHLIEEAFGIPVGTFDSLFESTGQYLPAQNRLKIIKYPPSTSAGERGQGVGPHKDSGGWLTFLLQLGTPEEAEGLQVLNPQNLEAEEWIPAPLIPDSFVVNFGNAFEAATSGGVRATVHRVLTPKATSGPRYSIPFFMGLPLDMAINDIKKSIPSEVHQLRSNNKEKNDYALDHKWEEEELGVAQLRKWFRSHREVAEKWYGVEVVARILE